MKIAYITTYDASDIKQWSGLGYFIYKKLEEKGLVVQLIGNLKIKNEFYQRMKRIFYKKIFRKIYRIERNPAVIRHYAKQILQRIDDNCDLIFSPSSIPVAMLATTIPVVFYTDATFYTMRNYYPEFRDYCSETIRHAGMMEKAAINNCSLAIYSSKWAADSATGHYGALPEKVKVIPFGANTVSNFSESEIIKIIKQRSTELLKLLFIGVYWHRKGGDKALEIANELNRKGLKTELHIMGKTPGFKMPPFVIDHGFIDKSTHEGQEHFNRIISGSHFLILPSQADCTPVVFSEANSFGLPCISTKTGGIPEIIIDGKNGFTFGINEGTEIFAGKIQQIFTDRKTYEQLALNSYFEYKNRLNWDVSVQKLITGMENLVRNKSQM